MEEVLYYENFDLKNVVTPVNADMLETLLTEANYDRSKTEFLVNGFREGFSIGYTGEENVKLTAPNLMLDAGSQTELWNKVMKEVKLNCFAGPFENIPFDNYIWSPIGLVSKDNGTKTHLIFHLSYPKTGTTSVNANTPCDLCTVHYCEFDQAIARSLEEGIGCKTAKSDMASAFRNLGIKKKHWRYLVLKARNPKDHKMYYFVDKCLPFGAAISCAHFQAFSDAIASFMKFRTGKRVINYLDDYFFAALCKLLCDLQVQSFSDLCKAISFPVSIEKTFWSTTRLTFLGMLIDTIAQIIAIPEDKILKAEVLIAQVLGNKKTMVHKLQSLCGFLNFLGRSVVPGRAFIRYIYASFSGRDGTKLKQHHHIRVSGELRSDLLMWQRFIRHLAVFSQKFIDCTPCLATEIEFFTDASKTVGFGSYCES